MTVHWHAATAVVCFFGVSTAAVHVPDNADGTYTNPVMMNAHWSDPSVLRVNTTYYLVTSSIETSPNSRGMNKKEKKITNNVGRSKPSVNPNPKSG